jgi:hypothetical protein
VRSGRAAAGIGMAVVLVLTIVIAGRHFAPVAIIAALYGGAAVAWLRSARLAPAAMAAMSLLFLARSAPLLFRRCSHPPRRSTS